MSSANGVTTSLAPNVVAIIPAYNEERFIGSVVLKTREHANTVIVVDDGSSDATGRIAQAAGAIVVTHEVNRGKGVALTTGLQKARELSPTAVVLLDADGQHVPGELGRVVSPVLEGQADIVVGSRYLENGSDVPTHRVLGHRAFNLMTNGASGVSLTDSQSGFRAFSPAALSAITFRSSGFSVESEMQFIARQHGLRMIEVPITVLYNDKPKRSVWAHGMMVLNGLLHMVGQYRPLLFFGVVGMLVLLGGLALGAGVVYTYERQQVLAVGNALITVLFIILGTLILFTGIILHSVRGMIMEIGSRAGAHAAGGDQ